MKINVKRKMQNAQPQFKSKNFLLFFLLFTFYFLLLPFDCYADTVPSTVLINNAIQHDGKTVVYEGEIIGDVMVRGEYCWLNINDGINAIGIWADKYLARNIIYTGGYRSKGDTVRVTGVFHRACLEHGGDLDIHALSLRKIISGQQFQEKLNVRKINFVIVLLVVLCLVWTFTLLKRK